MSARQGLFAVGAIAREVNRHDYGFLSRGAPPDRSDAFRSGGFFVAGAAGTKLSAFHRRRRIPYAGHMATMAERGIFLTRVASRRTLCTDHFAVTLALSSFPAARPGQFLQVLCRPPDTASIASSAVASRAAHALPLLRRPFSIAGLRRGAGVVEIDLIGRVVGPATAWLSQLRPGDAVDILGPLGTPFVLPPAEGYVMLVAGGVGLPPIRWLGEILRQSGMECRAVYGVRGREFLPVTLCAEPSKLGDFTLCVDEFAQDGVACAITTDDGSCGLRGVVTDVLRRELNGRGAAGIVKVYACGAEGMLEAVAGLCIAAGVACEVALERVMGCGMGTCQSCVVAVRDAASPQGRRYALCCTEGPAFDARRVIWR